MERVEIYQMVLDDRPTTTTPLTPGRARRQAVLRLARRAGTESDPQAILTHLLNEVQRLTGATGGFVGRWDEERQLLVDMIGGSNEAIGIPLTLAPGEGAGGRAAVERGPVIMNDYPALADASPRLAREGVHAAVAAPLLHEGRLLGVVVCASHDPQKRFTQDDADTLVMLGSVAASTLVELERAQTAQELQLLTERLEEFIEATSDAIVVTGTHLRLLGWNRGAERLYGWRRDDVLGRFLPNIPSEQQAETARLWQTVLETGQSVANVEQERLTRTGRRVPTLATISPMRDTTGSIVGVLEIAKDLTALKAFEEQQRKLSRAEEREAIAMDLHDNTLQTLHGAVLLLSALERQGGADPEYVRTAAGQVREQLTTAIQELRSRVLELRDKDAPRPGLVAGLQRLAEQVRSNVRTQVDLAIEPELESLIPAEYVDHLLAIANEAMFNAVRHARATRLQLELSRQHHALELAVWDDGTGFDTTRPSRTDAQGLANMSARARQLRGQLAVASRLGHGTEVRVQVPLRASNDGGA
ncbi:MAG: GAF domain-containing protein [Chloroflexi bacterium]|nr:GAF domain-containing protein [Chloroflexota bacterium]MBV9894579.1 GAF domain-containing protein [Chloroflexota bacterium]